MDEEVRTYEMLEVVETRLQHYKREMNHRPINYKLFDIYSFMAWSVDMFMNNLYEVSHHIDTQTIRTLLFVHIDQYNNWIDEAKNESTTERYCAALEAMKEIECLTRDFVS